MECVLGETSTIGRLGLWAKTLREVDRIRSLGKMDAPKRGDGGTNDEDQDWLPSTSSRRIRFLYKSHVLSLLEVNANVHPGTWLRT